MLSYGLIFAVSVAYVPAILYKLMDFLHIPNMQNFFPKTGITRAVKMAAVGMPIWTAYLTRVR